MDQTSNRYLQRAQRHSWEDGIAEICIGIGGILYAVFEALYPPLIDAMPDNETVRIILTTLLSMLVIALGLVSFRWLADRVKARTSYPRTGFVELKRKPIDRSPRTIMLTLLILPISIGMGLALALGLMLLFVLVKINAGLLLLSAMLAASAAARGRQLMLPRLYWLAGGILLVGMVLTATNNFGQANISPLFGLAGLLTLLSGGIALARYLRTHPVTTNEAQS